MISGLPNLMCKIWKGFHPYVLCHNVDVILRDNDLPVPKDSSVDLGR